MRGSEFAEELHSLWREFGTAGEEIIFLTEAGAYVPLDITRDDGRTVVLLLEEGK
jgi:hypothetical protein